MKPITYAGVGVDIDKYDGLLPAIKKLLGRSNQAGARGYFAGTLELEGDLKPGRRLVASVDGVGTKVKIARQVGRHTGIGRDIVAHCVNDILCVGARPVAFMDYVAFDRLEPRIFRQLLKGIAGECAKLGIRLLGGETAEMPGVYGPGEYDLVGFILGVVSRKTAIDGSRVRKGDLLVGLPSNGLHTNGYSLARRVLLGRGGSLGRRPRGWRLSVGSALLKSHTNYFQQVYPLVEANLVSGIAHITGGGIAGNLARVLPEGSSACLRKSLWRVPPIFQLIADTGPVGEDEMYRVFNMGLGMILVAPHSALPQVLKQTRASRVVGEIVDGDGEVIIE